MENNRLQLLQEKITLLFKTNKWVFVPLILLILFLVFLFSLLLQPQPEQQVIPSPTPSLPRTPTLTQQEENEVTEWQEDELEDDLTQRIGFLRKETLPDGTIQYLFASDNPNRPSLILTSNNNIALFERIVSTNEAPVAPITIFTETYGQPDQIIQGSQFYGPQASIYFYVGGMAFIANQQTGDTYEEHLFDPMGFEEYSQRFGNQN